MSRTVGWWRMAGALNGPSLVTVLTAFFVTLAHAEDAGEAVRTSAQFGKSKSLGTYDTICRTMVRSASDNSLPLEFFTRVIWQESRFNVRARSSAGAQGIAQFMPRTASSRGLLDPFDPLESLRQSASYLRELKNKFGSLGLAAAAYNAGPGRVAQWLSGKIHLPAETMAYVRLVTGRSIAEWTSRQPTPLESSEIPKGVPCKALASLEPDKNVDKASSQIERGGRKLAAWAPWGVQLIGDWTQDQVLARYENLKRKYPSVLGDKDPLVVITYGPSGRTKRYLARVAENTEQEAEQLCKRLQAVGGSCFAIRNRQ